MRSPSLCLAFLLVAAGARAQSPYVAATIGADIARTSYTESTFYPTSSSGSEVASWSLRVGTPVGENWGVELEFVRSGRSRGQVPTPIPLPAVLTGATPPVGIDASIVRPVPIGGFLTDVRSSRSDFDAVAWARHRAGSRIEMVYLGGVAFSRQRVEITQSVPTIILNTEFAPGGGLFRTTVVDYGTRPLVGTEARIGLTSHVRLLPGIRLQGIAGGWLVRPYAGLGWFF